MALTQYEIDYQAQQQSDRALEQEQAAAAAREIAQLEAVRTGDFDSITRASDSGSENAQKVRAAESLDTFLKTDPNDFKGNYQERQEQIREQQRVLDRLSKYGYSLGEADTTNNNNNILLLLRLLPLLPQILPPQTLLPQILV